MHARLNRTLLASAAFLLLSASVSRAQFYSDGSESAFVRWSHILTPRYDLIFPSGLDSLAKVYAADLEWAADAVGRDFPYKACEFRRRKLPVVLHPFAAYSNGASMWLPSQMSLYTCPSAYTPESTPWDLHLSVHESRHVAQTSIASVPKYRWAEILTGEMVGGGIQELYLDNAFIEGDAVQAETDLTTGGRGRSADFMEYMRAAFAQGDYRDYYQWRYGSFGKYTPDYYKVGYFTMNGMREVFDADFTGHWYAGISDSRSQLPVGVWGKAVRASSGLPFKKAWQALAHVWTDTNVRQEKGFTPLVPVLTRTGKHFEQYSSFCLSPDGIYAVRNGIRHTPELVHAGADGSTEVLRPFTVSPSSKLQSGPGGSVVWSECVPGALWHEKTASSDIFSYRDGKLVRLTRGGRYFNPAAFDDAIIAVEYPEEGGSQICRISADGKGKTVLARMPDGMQAVECVQAGDSGSVVFSAITDVGFGIYDLQTKRPVAGPVNAKIKDLRTAPGRGVTFVCDITGVDEAYLLCGNGSLVRLTDTGFGVGNPVFRGDTLLVSSLSAEERSVCLVPQPESEIAEFPAAIPTYRPEVDTTLRSEPYSRAAHALRFHSWLPLFFDYDAVADLSFENIYQSAGLGASVYTQNPLGTLSGMVGYRAMPSAAGKGWEHSGLVRATYTGLPVTLEARAEISNLTTISYALRDTLIGNETFRMMVGTPVSKPNLTASLNAYLPLVFNSAGWLRGVIPQISCAVSDNTVEGKALNRYAASVRAYAMLPVAQDAIYPRWGVGAQLGYTSRFGLGEYYPASAFAMLYGYFPGFAKNQNFHFYTLASFYSTNLQGRFTDPYIISLPRGFQSNARARSVSEKSVASVKAYLEYGLPCLAINSSFFSPLFYIRNVELIPRVETVYALMPDGTEELMGSAGLAANLVLGNLLFLRYETRVGLTFDLNNDPEVPYHLGFNFSISL